MPDALTIPARFNGPQLSGNGGYAAGALAAFIGEPAEVSLRSPVPLDKRLDVVRAEDGSVEARDGDLVIAEGRSLSGFDLELPAPVTIEEARAAAERYRGTTEGEFSQCFVCGLTREDGLEVFAGEVEGRGLVATPWTPPEWAADEQGNVRPTFVWAVLDCPAYFATHMEGELTVGLLARFAARIDAPIAAGEEHVVVAWPIEIDGRKSHAGAAVFSADGEPLAVARALMIEPRPA